MVASRSGPSGNRMWEVGQILMYRACCFRARDGLRIGAVAGVGHMKGVGMVAGRAMETSRCSRNDSTTR